MKNKRIIAHLSSSANAGYDMASGSARIERIKNAECVGRKGTMIAIIMILLFQFSFSFAENPSSENYILQQWGFASGNDPANPPTSTNYVLTGSAIGIISDEDAASSNYGMVPGYYLGPLEAGILPPQNVTISVIANVVHLAWNAVAGASSYSVYSSLDPYASYESWTLEESGIAGTNWNEAAGSMKYYYIKASTESRSYVNPNSGISNINIDKKQKSNSTVNSKKYKQKG